MATGGEPEVSTIDLLLIGPTGMGKSATGNSILGREAFKSDYSFSSVTEHVQFDFVKIDGQKVKVVDGPGIGDTRVSGDAKRMKILKKEFAGAVLNNPEGYHALLIVLEFGSRLNDGELKAVADLKQIFGPSLIKDHAIFVFSRGDEFDRNFGVRKISFRDWMDGERGENRKLHDLLHEVNNRFVLFYNRQKDAEKNKPRIKELLQLVSQIHERYTNEDFQNTRALRQYVLRGEGGAKSGITDNVLLEMALMLQDLRSLCHPGATESQRCTGLRNVKLRADSLNTTLYQQEKKDTQFDLAQDLLKKIKQCIEILSARHDAVLRVPGHEPTTCLKEIEDAYKKYEELKNKAWGDAVLSFINVLRWLGKKFQPTPVLKEWSANKK